MTTLEEYANKYKGRKVQCNEQTLKTNPEWKGWEGEIVGANSYSIEAKTLKISTRNNGVLNKSLFWGRDTLELIEEPMLISIKENNHPCPKCKQETCKGMDRIECLTREQQ